MNQNNNIEKDPYIISASNSNVGTALVRVKLDFDKNTTSDEVFKTNLFIMMDLLKDNIDELVYEILKDNNIN